MNYQKNLDLFLPWYWLFFICLVILGSLIVFMHMGWIDDQGELIGDFFSLVGTLFHNTFLHRKIDSELCL